MSAPSPDIYPVSPEQMARLSADLVRISEALEAAFDPAWLVVARAAATIDGVRLGIVRLDVGGAYGGAN